MTGSEGHTHHKREHEKTPFAVLCGRRLRESGISTSQSRNGSITFLDISERMPILGILPSSIGEFMCQTNLTIPPEFGVLSRWRLEVAARIHHG